MVQHPRDCIVNTILAVCHDSVALVILERLGPFTLQMLGHMLELIWDWDSDTIDPLRSLEAQTNCLLALVVEQAKRLKGTAWAAEHLPLESIGLTPEQRPAEWGMFSTHARANALAFIEKKATVHQADIDKQKKRLSSDDDVDDEPEDPAQVAREEAKARQIDAATRRMSTAFRARDRALAEEFRARRASELRAGLRDASQFSDPGTSQPGSAASEPQVAPTQVAPVAPTHATGSGFNLDLDSLTFSLGSTTGGLRAELEPEPPAQPEPEKPLQSEPEPQQTSSDDDDL